MRRKRLGVLLLGVAAAAFAGCGARDEQGMAGSGSGTGVRLIEEELFLEDAAQALESVESGMALDFAMEIPGLLDRNEASLEPYPALEELLVKHYGLTPAQCMETRYYYNEIDLNDDGVEEILAVLLGPYTTGESGSKGSLVVQGEKGLRIEKDFTQLNLPILISNESHEGWKDLILCIGDGSDSYHYMALRYENGAYGTGAQPIPSVEDIDGTVYLCNDLSEDIRTGRFLVLGQGLERRP